MLSKKQLVELNNKMLGLGAPVDRDDVGYNKPDYSLMYNLAYIPPEKLSDAFCAVMVDILRRYENTQLTAFRDEIDDTWMNYRDKLLKEKNHDFYGYINGRDTSFLKDANEEWLPKDLKRYHYNDIAVSGYNEKGVFLDFEDTRAAHTFKNNHDGVYYKLMDNNWYLFVPYGKLNDFVSIMENTKKKGIDGYKPTKELSDILSDIEAFSEKAEEEKAIADAEKLLSQSKSEIQDRTVVLINNDTDTFFLELYYKKYNRNMQEFKENHGNKVKNVNRNGEWHALVSYDVADKWAEAAKKAGLILSSEVESLCSDTEKLIADAEKAFAEKHKNHNSLIDIDTLPLPFEPYKFQIEDAEKLLTRDRMLIGSDMGTGKTFISGLVGASIEGRKLVICPESLRLNWKKEVEAIGQEAVILYSKDDFHISEDKNGFTICGYQTAAKFLGQLKASGFSTVFVDEVHNCKAVSSRGEPSSQRARAVVDIVRNTKYAYLLSGTPVPTRNKDLYNILKMLDVKELDFNKKFAFFEYGQKYCDGVNNGYGWNFEGNSQSDELHNILAPYMVRRLKKDVLPNLTKQRICMPLEIHNRKYEKIEDKILGNMEDDETYMGLAMTGRRLLSESKVQPAIEFADGLLNEGKSVVIVSNFNDTLESIKDKYKDDCCIIKGGMSDIQKQKSIDDFQAGKCHVCALNIIAGGVGVTLTKAHDMIIVDYDWTPSNMVQVEDRICRVGQTEPCNIHYLYGNDCIIDEIFVNMITDKNANIDRLIDNAENTMNLSGVREHSSKGYMELLKEYAEAEMEKKGIEPKKKSSKKSKTATEKDDI